MRRPPRCNCHCKPSVDFRVFDASDGTLLWERLLTRLNPTVGLDGRVWEMEPLVVRGAGTYSVGVSPSVSMPARYASDTSQQNMTLYRAVSYNGTNGELSTTSPYFTFLDFTVNGFGGFGSPSATRYTVNSSGHYVHTINGSAATIRCSIVNNLQSTPVDYYFSNSLTTTGSISLTTIPASSTASFSITASAATIKSAIESAFSGLYNSVTVAAVAGTNVFNGLIKVTIDWNAPGNYINNMSIASRTQTTGASLIDLETGETISRGGTSSVSFSYSRHGVWLTETKIVRISSASGDSSQPIVEAWDTSTNPWTLAWSDAYASGHSTYVSGESKFPIAIAARNSQCAMAVARMGSTPFSVKTYSETGTVLATMDYGYKPYRLMFSDDSDEIAALFLNHTYSQLCGNSGIRCGDIYYTSHDGAAYAIMDTTGGALDLNNSGQFQSEKGAGFNSDMIAVICDHTLERTGTDALTIGDTSNGGAATIDSTWESAASGLINPFLPSTAYYSRWYIGLNPEWLFYNVQWRLNFISGTFTAWLDETSTLSDLNTELLSMFGADVDGRQNVVADVWNTLPTYKSGMEPLFWQQYLRVTARCARNSTEATDSGMDLTLSASSGNSIARLRVEVQTYQLRRTATIAMLDRSDGSEVWSRGFSASQPNSQCRGLLHDGKLYAQSYAVTYPGEL